MKVITKHGKSKPSKDDLTSYQQGWTTGTREYGPDGDGKILYIRDDSSGTTEIIPVTQGFLREEFVNYVLGNDGYGNVGLSAGNLKYDDISEAVKADTDLKEGQTFGLTSGLTVTSDKSIIDENEKTMGHRITIDWTNINTANREFYTSQDAGKSIVIDSISPTYIAQLKNSIEQKAFYVVNCYAADEVTYTNDSGESVTLTLSSLTDTDEINHFNAKNLLTSLITDEKAEAGIQILVKYDENHNNDSWIYVLTCAADSKEHAVGDVWEDTTTDKTKINLETQEGFFSLEAVAVLEYKYHDPIGTLKSQSLEVTSGVSTDTTGGLGVYTSDKDDKANTVKLGLTDETVNTIVESFNDATTIDSVMLGKSVNDLANAGVKTSDPNNYKSTEALSDSVQTGVDNAEYTAYAKVHTKTFSDDGEPTETVKYIDFGNFILDEGTWDEPVTYTYDVDVNYRDEIAEEADPNTIAQKEGY